MCPWEVAVKAETRILITTSDERFVICVIVSKSFMMFEWLTVLNQNLIKNRSNIELNFKKALFLLFKSNTSI